VICEIHFFFSFVAIELKKLVKKLWKKRLGPQLQGIQWSLWEKISRTNSNVKHFVSLQKINVLFEIYIWYSIKLIMLIMQLWSSIYLIHYFY